MLWVPFHHGTVCPVVVDGGQLSIGLISSCRQPTRGDPLAWSLDRGLTTPQNRKFALWDELLHI